MTPAPAGLSTLRCGQSCWRYDCDIWHVSTLVPRERGILLGGWLQEGMKPGQSRPQAGSNCHFGCILALERIPFLPHVVLSAGGYDWALYQDHFLEAPLMRGPYAPVQYTCAAWSPTRPGD